jgi:hypothetical protein
MSITRAFIISLVLVTTFAEAATANAAFTTATTVTRP